MSKTKEKFIPIEQVSKPTAEPRIVSYDEFERHRRTLNWTFGFIVAVLVICFTSFILFLLDAYRFHSQVLAENTRSLQALQQENQYLKIARLENRLHQLEDSLASRQRPIIPTSKQSPTQKR